MKKASEPKRSNATRRKRKADSKEMNQATSAEFEREDMGIAPKE